ncbi:helix-turn-helix domain-containing protein [Streptomyces sp. TS71-3]|uniref:helix-turn-helix domain-containing protein n=1 Tax=Streptomyces sp. TS71-3 TaxID=2733862 RepID=UPI001B27FBDC|nr:helix-turn-helix domain-containing protein [Streptomyces sp. TS71-3]GHJ35265.1 hypothetical protein Sm713_08740 [Streptomyces sp. TS71-3]
MSNDAPNRARVIPLRPVRPAQAGHPARSAHPARPARSDGPAGPATGPVTAPGTALPGRPGGRPGEPGREPLWRDVLGDVLRRRRLAQRRTLKDVAEAARISMPYLSEVERGRKEASSEVLAAAARALGLGLADLLALVQGELARSAGPRRITSDAAPTAPAAPRRVPPAHSLTTAPLRPAPGPRSGEVRMSVAA